MRDLRLLHQQHREDPADDQQETADLQGLLHLHELLHAEEELLPEPEGQGQQLPPVHLQPGAVVGRRGGPQDHPQAARQLIGRAHPGTVLGNH